MLRYIVVSVTSGLVFGVLDGLIHTNPIAIKVYRLYQPIQRTKINVPIGVLIDLIYGFIMAGLFLLLNKSIPGTTEWQKGLIYGCIIWFFRVVMHSVSNWMMFEESFQTLLYTTLAGFIEMMIIGLIYGMFLKG